MNRVAAALLVGFLVIGSAAPANARQQDDRYAKAMRAVDNGNYERALRLFKELAAEGHARACHDVGVMYFNGEGTAPDLVESYAWYSLAIERGYDSTEYRADVVSELDAAGMARATERAKELARQLAGGNAPVASAPAHRHDGGAAGSGDEPATDGDGGGIEPAFGGAPADVAAPDGTLRMRPYACFDPGIGVNAFTMLIPADWQVEGGVVWNHDLANLATTNLRVFDPQSAAQLQLIPLVPFTWSQNGIFGFPQGSVYMGSFVQPPPRGSAEFVKDYVLPQLRGGARNLEIQGAEPLADVARALATQNADPSGAVRNQYDAVRVRIGYQENGRKFDEDVYCVLRWTTSSILSDNVLWQADYLYSFRAEKGRLDALAPVLKAMVGSMRLSLEWYAGYQYVFDLYMKRQGAAIRSAGELSRQISQMNDEMIEMNRASWEKQQRTYDRLSEQFSEYVRGTEHYDDPYLGRPVELPSGYDDAWVSETGEYILSNDANFNPNEQSTVNWQRMGTKP